MSCRKRGAGRCGGYPDLLPGTLTFEKAPKVVVFGQDIPVTTTGKYQRLRLQDRFAEWEHTQFRK